MKKYEVVQKLHELGAFAVVRADQQRAFEISEALIKGGLPALEVSYTLNTAGDTIHALKEHFHDDLLVGAGTVLDPETARLAILNGADFIIAPNYSEEVSKMCNRYQIPYAPGCTSVSECVDAMSMGASFIKAFPISNFYGPKLVKIFKTPIPNMPIMASGGITLENIDEWLECGVDVCGIGGLLTKGSKEEISKNAQAIKNHILTFRENSLTKR